MDKRASAIQAFLDTFRRFVPDYIIIGADHPWSCKCAACKLFWVEFGPDDSADPESNYGPFSAEEIREMSNRQGGTSSEAA